jgi:transcriptional regulator with XRE-family HTH domain
MTRKGAPARPAHRPSKYDPLRHPDIIGTLARKGLTDEQIAHDLGISRKTLSVWKKVYVAVDDTLKEGKLLADGKVEASLYRRACGYSYTERKTIEFPDGSTRKEITEKVVAPDVTAGIFWLKNRQPENWRDVQRQELTGPGGEHLLVKVIRIPEEK